MNKFEQWIGNYPDFPKKGILFRDISPLLASPEGMSLLKKEFLKLIADWKPDLIAGIIIQGFVTGWTPLTSIRTKPLESQPLDNNNENELKEDKIITDSTGEKNNGEKDRNEGKNKRRGNRNSTERTRRKSRRSNNRNNR